MIVLDTGVLVAAAHAEDIWHEQAVAILDRYDSSDLVLPLPVVPETAWMIGSRLDPATEAAFVMSVADGDFTLVDLSSADWRRAAELIARYADLDLGVVDASIVAVAERLRIETVATVNPRDFRVVRPRHVAAFELLP